MLLREAYNKYSSVEFGSKALSEEEFEQEFKDDEIGLAYTDYYCEEEDREIPLQTNWDRKTQELKYYIDEELVFKEPYTEEQLIETLSAGEVFDSLISEAYSRAVERYEEDD